MLRYVLSAGLLAAMVGSADAAPKCSPGKIYRVSKKVCVDKTAALRDGVISPRQKAAVTRKAAKRTALQKYQADRARVERPTASQAPEAEQQDAGERERHTPRIIVPPARKVIGWAMSPFGALVDPWNADFSAPPEARLSPRFSTEN
jgi:hypothetical protein